jgi:peptidoglycan/LPS O-acetylase OafA/YrhL
MVFVGVNALHAFVRAIGNETPLDSGDTGLDLMLNLALMNGLDIRPPSFNTPSWSISTEFWTYVLFGSVVLGFRNVRRCTMAIVFAGVCICALAVVYQHYGEMKGFVLYFFPRCVFGFFLGAAMGTLVVPATISPVNGSSAIGTVLQVVAIVIAVSILTVVGFSGLEVFLPMLFAAVVGTFVIWPHSRLAQALSSRPLLWLGKHSYSIYMVHWFVLMQVATLLRGVFHVSVVKGQFELSPASGLAITILAIAIILVAASQTYRFIEDPGRRFGRRLLKRNRSPRTVNPAEPSSGAPTGG